MNSQSTLRPLAILLGGVLGVLLVLCGYQWTAMAMNVGTLAQQHIRLIQTYKEATDMQQTWKTAALVNTMVAHHPAGWEWSEQLPVSIKQLADIEQSAGVAIDTLQPATIVSNQQLSRFPIHVTLHTTLARLTTFLHGVQQATPLCAVDQMTIHAGKTPGDLLVVDLTLSTYAIIEKAATTGGKS